jgi:hypothetical protein
VGSAAAAVTTTVMATAMMPPTTTAVPLAGSVGGGRRRGRGIAVLREGKTAEAQHEHERNNQTDGSSHCGVLLCSIGAALSLGPPKLLKLLTSTKRESKAFV